MRAEHVTARAALQIFHCDERFGVAEQLKGHPSPVARLPDEVVGGKAGKAAPHGVESSAAPVEIGQLGIDQRLEGDRRRIGGERFALPAGDSGGNETIQPAAHLVVLPFEVYGEPRSIASGLRSSAR